MIRLGSINPFIRYAKFSEKLFRMCAYQRVRNVSFSKNCLSMRDILVDTRYQQVRILFKAVLGTK